MIPEFEEDGLLPAGVYEASLPEFEQRFVYNLRRKQIYEGIVVLIQDLKNVGCSVMYIDGSYVTAKVMPGDADICWELKPDRDYISFVKLVSPVLLLTAYPRVEQKKRYKADVLPATAPADGKGTLYRDFFREDKNTGKSKGIIKIILS